MITGNTFGLIVTAVLLVYLFWQIRKQRGWPVQIRTLDEIHCIYAVAVFAMDQLKLKRNDPRLRNALRLRAYMVPIFCRIPAEELRALAPFIDAFIDGNGPPISLPNEYHDYRPAVLKAFKDRMTLQRLWPEAHVLESGN